MQYSKIYTVTEHTHGCNLRTNIVRGSGDQRGTRAESGREGGAGGGGGGGGEGIGRGGEVEVTPR